MAGEHGDNGNQGDGHEQVWDGGDQPPVETERLDLVEDEGRLPWLESADDELEDEGTGNGRMLGLAALSGVVLLAIVGGIWFVSNSGGTDAAVADGSVIAAPQEPYKVAPKDPGGKTFAGTGDTSFAVSEGQSNAATMGENTGAPTPPVAPASGSAAPAPAIAGVGVQVGAYSSQATAEAGWTRLVDQSSAVLKGVPHRVVEGNADIGKVYRLQAVAANTAEANALCARLKGAGVSCQVK